MNENPDLVKQTLFSIIDDMEKYHWLFSSNPGHDFMRQYQGRRKIKKSSVLFAMQKNRRKRPTI